MSVQVPVPTIGEIPIDYFAGGAHIATGEMAQILNDGAPTLGALAVVENLGDLDDAAEARANLDVPSNDEAVLVENNLSDVVAATARTNLNVPSNAEALLVANDLSDVDDPDAARLALDAGRFTWCGRADLVGASANVYRYVHRGPNATIAWISTAITDALTTGNATLTAAINGTPVTTGVVTIAQAASAAGDVDGVQPTAANVIATGQVLTLTVGGTNDATEFADFVVHFTY